MKNFFSQLLCGFALWIRQISHSPWWHPLALICLHPRSAWGWPLGQCKLRWLIYKCSSVLHTKGNKCPLKAAQSNQPRPPAEDRVQPHCRRGVRRAPAAGRSKCPWLCTPRLRVRGDGLSPSRASFTRRFWSKRPGHQCS